MGLLVNKIPGCEARGAWNDAAQRVGGACGLYGSSSRLRFSRAKWGLMRAKGRAQSVGMRLSVLRWGN